MADYNLLLNTNEQLNEKLCIIWYWIKILKNKYNWQEIKWHQKHKVEYNF